MNKAQALQYLINAMSLRTPQEKSLVLFSDYLESEAGKKLLARLKRENRTGINELETETKGYLNSISTNNQFESFERTFPSFTFALATGVGKTRLMGVFVAYLYLVYEVQHFMIVAPGNTIYRKLVDDFSKANNPKYVFRGVEEINISTTRIVTKDNYQQNQSNASLFGNKIQINIFNIQQFAQKDVEQEKGITKFSETLGESYFDYLNSLEDLVVLMDESHHYHADAAMTSLDRIDPFLGLEFTATPYTGNMTGRGKDRQPELKKNIIYFYNLGDAIKDGYVKDPWVGTEADVNFSQWDNESIETDARKLQLAAFFHERAKSALKQYALVSKKQAIKPVLLVVAKDTAHASALRALIDSDQFRGGAYIGKVIEVHTKTRGDEADETIEKLISLEDKDNIVEIVVHVNMLKEGWDVANIYTIAPIRSSASEILTEQTIGRGLRLPYGERTGDKFVDRVMIVAHDNYAKIIEQARDSKLIQPSNIESVSAADAKVIKEIIEVQPAIIVNIEEKIRANKSVMLDIISLATKEVTPHLQTDTPKDVIEQTIKNKTDQIVEAVAKQSLPQLIFSENQLLNIHEESLPSPAFGEGTLFNNLNENSKNEIVNIGRTAAQATGISNIVIPRLQLLPHYNEVNIADFNLAVNRLTRYASDTAIITQRLQAKEELDLFGNAYKGTIERELTRVTSLGEGRAQSPENTIISGLIDFPLVDYEDANQKPLLLKLAEQAVTHYRSFVSDANSLKMMIENNYHQIAQEIYTQILDHKQLVGESYLESVIAEPKPYLEQYNISRTLDEKPVTLESQLNRFPKDKIYTGFEKACHSMYRFDSSDEARFAYIADKDIVVVSWLRPAPTQFDGLFWRDELGDSQHRYEPDFVIELQNEVVLIEVKPKEEIDNHDVQEKKKTADKYCEIVSKNIGRFGITKPWRYIIIPTEKITVSSTILGLLK
jgi:type III restriction enzyme